ncbi:hypothetical protein [Tateyamaria sp. SN3-11]|uniref:hypothetical protein n=1 Tax=Tateyamaria sp. SN3-11 TaxID=3092147 RepID=UPI0039E7F3B5
MVGEVPVTSPDLTGDLTGLRKAGMKVKTKRLRTKLIIPDDQIRYLSIETGDVDDAAREKAALVALEGATPYPVDALAFDISPDGSTTHVAAVARETLAEAEAFAVEHRFNPVSFVAAPVDAEFLGEPFFGPTAHSKMIIPEGRTVEADGVRVVIVDPVPEDAAPEKPKKTDAPDAEAEAEAEASTPETAEPAKEEPAEDVGEVKETQDASDTKDDATEPEEKPDANAEPEAKPEPKAEDDAKPDPVAASEAAADGEVEADAKDKAEAAPEKEAEPTPPLLGFATRRRQDPTSTPTPTPLGGVTRKPPAKGAAPALKPKPPAPAPAITPNTPPKAVADSLRPVPAPTLPDVAVPEAAKAARTGGFLSRRKPGKAKDTGRTGAKLAARTAAQGPNADVESQRMTVFGARGEATVGGKPRYLGLILMAVLLVFLAGVAAWASVFLDDKLSSLFPGRERTLASTLPDDTQAALAEDVGVTTTPEETEQNGVAVAALNDSLTEGLSAEDAAVLDALRDPMPAPAPPEELDAAALEARYAVTGIWPKAPEVPQPTGLIDIEDLYVTGIDSVSPALDAVALPSAASFQTDKQMAALASPSAPGTNFARDAQGRIIPTAEGALSPDGFTVFLGQPPAIPPATPVRFENEPVVPPLLARVRPQPRPSDLVEQNERATLGGLSRIELAALRPRLRPQAPQEIETETNEAAETPEPVQVLAAMTTLRPQDRPRNFKRIVARAERNSAPSATVRTAAVAPRTVTPAIPSTASVTREATVRNAINLSRVNLIGVYGTPSDRRALVRLSNGRYQKVKVGDRFDGGRISAIGDAELRYQKGSRNVVLKMPKS